MAFDLKKITLLNLFTAAGIIIFAVNIGIIITNKNIVGQKVKAAEELKRPASINLKIVKDSSCADCADLQFIIDAIKKTNVRVEREESFEASSTEGKKLIQDFEIKKLPAFMIDGEVNKNEDVKALLGQIGEIKENVFKLNYPVAPYVDVASNSVKGRVQLVLIADKTCAECYDVNVHKSILARLGVSKLSLEKTLDKSSAEGWALIAKYKIKSIPAFVLTGEVGEYAGIAQVWPKVGTIEKDGAYVFREITQLGAVSYRDLITGKIIKPATTSPAPVSSPAPAAK